MILIKKLGGYLRDAVEIEGSFRINGTSDPDDIRDGNSNLIASVTRGSAGLFTVTFADPEDGGPTDLPYELITAQCDIMQAAAPSSFVKPHIVVDSYSSVTRDFDIQCIDFSTPSATDPDDDDVITFRLVGSISTQGTDTSY
jgi:hypothetical protein